PAARREHAKLKTKPKPLKPKPVIQPRHEAETAHIQKVEKKPARKAQASISSAAVASAPVKQLSVDDGLVARERLKYLAKVIAHIERHKYYPPTARRRGIQGDVHIRFVLLADGTTRQVMVEGASSVLQKAARKAVIRAVPMPRPPTGIHCPMHCEFAMRYALK
ncbi:MAG: TonB family protein, partial [Mariprofundus sp.]|nr:TonB family protein [Mariprofundus sp.]